ncbi:MAG: TonB-dependent receptor [Sphingomonadales bacterium]|nr:TonB-dependent receptor [Sphingomonadales bacterium]
MPKAHLRKLWQTGAAVLVALSVPFASALAQPRYFDIASQPLGAALLEFGEQSGINVAAPRSLVEGKTAPAVKGTMEPSEALNKILDGSGLKSKETSTGAFTIDLAQLDMGRDAAGPTRIQVAQADVVSDATRADASREESLSDDTEIVVDLIIVTAQRREQSLIDVPMSVATFSGAHLEQHMIASVNDLSYQVPGMTVIESAPGSQQYTLRGLGASFGDSPMVGVYLDEVDVTPTNPFSQMNVSLYDLERVEVLQGAQGTLWGAGSVGGTLRFITKAPELDRFGAKADIAFMDQARGESGVAVRGALNIPIIEDSFGIRITATHENLGGWIDQPGAGLEDFNDSEQTNVRVRVRFVASEDFEVNGTAIISRSSGNGRYTVNVRPSNLSQFQSFIEPDLETPFTDNYEHFNLTIRYDFAGLSLVSATGYTSGDGSFVDTRRLTFAGDFLPPFPSSQLFVNTEGAYDYETFTQELRLASDNDSIFSWVVGAFYRDGKHVDPFLTTQAIGDGVIPPIVLAADIPSEATQESESISVYANGALRLGDSWEIGAGIRYFYDDRRSFDPTSTDPASEGSFDDFSPRVYLSYGPRDDLSFYFSVAQGFRSGGFNTPAIVAAGGPATYEPDNVRSFELGVKSSLFGGKLFAEAAVFYSKFDDIQGAGLLPGLATSVSFNIGTAKIKGFDWYLRWLATDNLTFGFNGNVVDTEVTELNATFTQQNVGDPLDYVAEFSWSATADYTFNLTPKMPGYARLAYAYQGEMPFTIRSAGLAVPVTFSDKIDLLSASVGLNLAGFVDIEVFATNLLDEDGFSTPWEIITQQSQPRPRTIGIRLGREL